MLIVSILKVADSQSSMEEKDNFDYWKQSNLENLGYICTNVRVVCVIRT